MGPVKGGEKLCSGCAKPATVLLVSSDGRETLSCDGCKEDLEKGAAMSPKQNPRMSGKAVSELRPVTNRRL
jgi:hypothetical protein